MSATNEKIDSYVKLLVNAPVLLRSKSGDAGPVELPEGLYRVGGNGEEEAMKYVEAGPDAAQFLAHAIAPFMEAETLDREAIIEGLINRTPPALGDGARALAPEEAGRVADVCEMLRMLEMPTKKKPS